MLRLLQLVSWPQLRASWGRTALVVGGIATGVSLIVAIHVINASLVGSLRATIDAYVASGEPFGKAGAYAIQSALAGWVERIDGSHSGIMGLPLFETAQLLQRAGVPTALSE